MSLELPIAPRPCDFDRVIRPWLSGGATGPDIVLLNPLFLYSCSLLHGVTLVGGNDTFTFESRSKLDSSVSSFSLRSAMRLLLRGTTSAAESSIVCVLAICWRLTQPLVILGCWWSGAGPLFLLLDTFGRMNRAKDCTAYGL